MQRVELLLGKVFTTMQTLKIWLPNIINTLYIYSRFYLLDIISDAVLLVTSKIIVPFLYTHQQIIFSGILSFLTFLTLIGTSKPIKQSHSSQRDPY